MSSPRRFPPVRPSPKGEGGGAGTAELPAVAAPPLGRLLIEARAAGAEQVRKALEHQRKSFLPLGRILRDEFGLPEKALELALRRQKETARIYLRFFPAASQTLALLDPAFCRQHELIAFEKLDTLLCVAFSRPGQEELARLIERQTGWEVKAFLAPADDILRKLGASPGGAST
jgi:hypothetical protein